MNLETVASGDPTDPEEETTPTGEQPAQDTSILTAKGHISWETVESRSLYRAIAIHTFSLGGTARDVAGILSKQTRVPISKASVDNRVFLGGTRTQQQYVEHLLALPIPEDILSEAHARAYEYLRENHVQVLWRNDQIGRAIALYTLKEAQSNPYILALVLNKHYNSNLEYKDIKRFIRTLRERIERKRPELQGKALREEVSRSLLHALQSGPEPLADEELAIGREAGKQLMREVATERFAGSDSWRKSKPACAFVAEMAERNVPARVMVYALEETHKFTVSKSFLLRYSRKKLSNAQIAEDLRQGCSPEQLAQAQKDADAIIIDELGKRVGQSREREGQDAFKTLLEAIVAHGPTTQSHVHLAYIDHVSQEGTRHMLVITLRNRPVGANELPRRRADGVSLERVESQNRRNVC